MRVPGSKSITNRALAIGALKNSMTVLGGALKSRDTYIMQQCLMTLGRKFGRIDVDSELNFTIREEYSEAKCLSDTSDEIGVLPLDGDVIFPNHKGVTLHVGNAGTAARFLTALLCLQPEGEFYVDGDEAMYRRPMKGLTDALESLGAQFTFHKTPGCIPFTLKTAPITKDYVEVDARESSQILSALLIMAAGLGRPFEVRLLGKTVSEPFVEMTAKMLHEDLGVNVSHSVGGIYRIEEDTQRKGDLVNCAIEPDATAASYFLSLPIATISGGSCNVKYLQLCMWGRLQGDIAYFKVLENVGLSLTNEDNSVRPHGPKDIRTSLPADVTPRCVTADFEAFSDTFLTLAALTPLLEGKTRISGIAHTRKQETDRVAAMARELKKLGQHVVEEEGALEVTPDLAAMKALARKAREDAANGLGNASGCIEIDTYHDHRFAMSFAILGCRDLLGDGKPWLAIRDPKCCGKTFPNFFDVLEDAWKQSHSESPAA